MSTPALKGPAWVTVRQYRRTLWVAGALAVLAFAVIGGLRIWVATVPDTYVLNGETFPTYDHSHSLLRLAVEELGKGLIILPLLVGALAAGPLVAREYETGTYQLSLTQSVSPAVWLRSKLLTATAAAVLTAGALMAVHWLGWIRITGGWTVSRYSPGTYLATGVALFAHLLAAVAVGALLGLLIRRTLVAMAATGLVLGVVLLVLGALRWSFLPVRTVTAPLGGDITPPDNGLMMDWGLQTSSGARFDQSVCWQEVNATVGMSEDPSLMEKAQDQCLARHDVTAQYLDYHPFSHFWPTQLIETGIVLALAALAAFAAFRVLRARHP
ncbi:ABC transporter permease [Streptomyces sp. R302]|uniref:ABC transporter permease n=1 Tax=unclassified Streptomyces TaxID=2593676 RepID=UPI00145CAECA|nr:MULTISPECIES: ABC transporter permease [unclassified Streptomyces]NML49912.1 ABC transporter permease [Streptomyces sp. R301]NML78903.1 ABC transporter permease [Streptomyces sp. R302]